MSLPQTRDRICSACIDDADIAEWIGTEAGPRGCHFCRRRDAPTADLDDLADMMRSRLSQYYGDTSDIPYESAEGGYQAPVYSTYELLLEEVGLQFPRDVDDRLAVHLADAITDQLWAEYDWTRLDIDQALLFSWKEFCETIKHRRRFFFAEPSGKASDDEDQDETYEPLALLREISRMLRGSDVIKLLPKGAKFYRARPDDGKGPYRSPASLGPPPTEYATQSNRMNPPGIPMMYVADSSKLAMAEARSTEAYVGTFVALRDIRILDLDAIPPAPGIFSTSDRRPRLELTFLREFERSIMQPVPRDDRLHVDYIPSQVVTEFFREFGAGGETIDGIAYGSTVLPGRRNTVLFATQDDIEGATEDRWFARNRWLALTKSGRVPPKPRSRRSKTTAVL